MMENNAFFWKTMGFFKQCFDTTSHMIYFVNIVKVLKAILFKNFDKFSVLHFSTLKLLLLSKIIAFF